MIALALLRGVYALLAAIAIAFELVPWTREAFVKYGRTRGVGSGPPPAWTRLPCAEVVERFASATVPKNLFSQFYWVGAMAACLVLLDSLLGLWHVGSSNVHDSSFGLVHAFLGHIDTWAGHPAPQAVVRAAMDSRRLAAIAGLSMYTGHVLARLKETVCDQPATQARMHIGQYAVGMIFYIITPVAVVADAYCKHLWRPVSLWMIMAGTSLFVYASVHQWRCHHILFRLRRQQLARVSRQPQPAAAYALPSSDLFDYVSSPHYLCEVLVYVSLWIATGCQAQTLLWVVLWTAVNLGITARESQLWYRRTFGHKFPQARRALVPFVW
ncbi:hypothetical protein IWW55_005423 [Coemansia sp. RSA 2706]|nr:hypothetical protein IWW55_005423 [Coemansia sp. RSA 2706]KAJ2309327.1 hypothetical protein IWW52_005724 [Coemansia sp. RSA 2704]